MNTKIRCMGAWAQEFKLKSWLWRDGVLRGMSQLLSSGQPLRGVLSRVVVLFAFGICAAAFGQDSVCARVRIEIQQQLTLERQGFEARMTVNNGVPGVSLDGIAVDVLFSDTAGQPVRASSDPNDLTATFFIRLQTGSSIPDSVPGETSAQITWLIIPAPGAAGLDPQGQSYSVGATLQYRSGGQSYDLSVSPDTIWVKPMPMLSLDYFLPREVYGDDPFTPDVVEPPVPYSLGVRVANTGHGPATSVRIESAQPKIVDNKLGLLVDFRIQGSEVNGKPATTSLTCDFGDVAANRAGIARWIMTSTLSGRFVDFSAYYTHADDLGGRLTSLIDGTPRTHLLVWDVLVDLPGRDGIRDFLARDAGTLKVYESDNVDSAVADLSSVVSLGVNGSVLTLTPQPTPGFLYIQKPDPYAGRKVITNARRADGKLLPIANAWFSKTNDSSTHQWSYFVNVFDANNPSGLAYTLTVGPGPGSTNHPPVLDPLPDRNVEPGAYLNFIVSATDPDGDGLRFALRGKVPSGATMDQKTGAFSWRPSEAQSGVNRFTVVVSDDGQPSLSATNSFTVIVKHYIELSVGSTVLQVGQDGCVPVNLRSAVALTNLGFTVLYEPDRLTNWQFTAANAAIGGSAVQMLGSSQAFFSLSTRPGQMLQGSTNLGTLCFTASPGSSAFVPLILTNITGVGLDGTLLNNVLGHPGRVVVVGAQPLLEASLSTNSHRRFTLYGNPGASYLVTSSTDWATTNWSLAWRIPLTNLSETFEVSGALPRVFYRANEFAADPPLLELGASSGTNATLLLYGRAGSNYVVEATANQPGLGAWLTTTSFLLTNSFQFIDLTDHTNTMRFYRAKRP